MHAMVGAGVLALTLPDAYAADVPAPVPAVRPPAISMEKLEKYRKDLAAYERAWNAYEKVAVPYWRSVTEKRSRRRTKMANGMRLTAADYVMQQPPVYKGPPKPNDPAKSEKPGSGIPEVKDFLEQGELKFGFTPEHPVTERGFKRAYAEAALAGGLTRDVAVKIYGFEAGGNGNYDIQAGREYDMKAPVISTALGYNQLLTTNTISLLAASGDEFLAAMEKKAGAAEGERRRLLQAKIVMLKRMIAFARSVPNEWSAHGRLANTPKGIGAHALNLDIDIGPLLQVRKLTTSVDFIRRKGHTKPIAAAELEMMNLTGDGNGYDMYVMPKALREKVPTSNFFQRGGYERNPVAARNNTVAKLIAGTDAKMVREAKLQGAKDMAAAFDAVKQARQ
jgi:hypothetical protein